MNDTDEAIYDGSRVSCKILKFTNAVLRIPENSTVHERPTCTAHLRSPTKNG
jgi:hypothetical protein